MRALKSFDYKILSGYMENYQTLVDEYKAQASQMTEQRYNRVNSIIKGITQVYNNATLQEQQLINMLWWNKQPYDIIADVLGVTEYTIKHAREVLLRRVAKKYISMIYDKKSVRAFIMNYEPPNEEPPMYEENINNFFSLDQPTTSIETSDNFEEHIFLMNYHQ